MQVILDDGSPLISRLEVADTFCSRMIGLLGRSRLPDRHGLYITRCSSIHTFFMRFSIDLVFVDSEMRIVKVARNITPFRIVFGGRGASAVLEVQTGWLETGLLKQGACLGFE
jgi:uncharacterized membrane protein (UPF0127 family)